MKKLKYIALSLIVGISATSFAQQTRNMNDQGVIMVFDPYGHEVPFPTKAIIRFPWELIEGYWAVSIADMKGIFRLLVDSRDPAHKKLSIQFLDLSGTQVLAQGSGSLDTSEKLLRAVVVGPRYRFAVEISAFRLHGIGYDRTEMVTSLQMAGDADQTDKRHYVIRKIRQ